MKNNKNYAAGLIILSAVLFGLVSYAAGENQERLMNESKSYERRITLSEYVDTLTDAQERETDKGNNIIYPTAKTDYSVDVRMLSAEKPLSTAEVVDSVDKQEWKYELTDEELRLIACVIEREDNTDADSLAACAEVILNRIGNPKFRGQDTVTEVLYARGQFQTVWMIEEGTKPSEEAVNAVLAVFRDGESVVGEEAIFFSAKNVEGTRIANNLYLIDIVGGSAFWGQK